MGGFIMRSTAEDLQLWENRINERIKSGMTVSKWCKENEVSKNKYHYWNNRINKIHGENKEVTFAEVSQSSLHHEDIVSNSSSLEDKFHIVFKNMQIAVPSNFNKSALAALMEVLKEL